MVRMGVIMGGNWLVICLRCNTDVNNSIINHIIKQIDYNAFPNFATFLTKIVVLFLGSMDALSVKISEKSTLVDGLELEA
jgi:hypothetical protein